MENKLKYRLVFLGSAEPFVVPKIQASTIRTKAREGISLITSMQGYIQVYYINKLALELTKKNMTKSIFLTTVSQMLKNKNFDPTTATKIEDGITNKDDVWVFCDNANAKAIKNKIPCENLTETHI